LIESSIMDFTYLYVVKGVQQLTRPSDDPLAVVSDSESDSLLSALWRAHLVAWEHGVTLFWSVYTVDCVFWPAVQMNNFLFTPASLQTPVVAIVSVGWGAFLSFMSSTAEIDSS